MNNNQEVFDVPTLGYTDWEKTIKMVIQFGIKNWKEKRNSKAMFFNFPQYVRTVSQHLTFVGQFNNRIMLAGLLTDATWNKTLGKVVVTYSK